MPASSSVPATAGFTTATARWPRVHRPDRCRAIPCACGRAGSKSSPVRFPSREAEVIRKALAWLDDRSGLVTSIKHALTHPVPPRTGWWYTFGSATFLAFVLQVVTGIALATAYVPSSGQAYDSLKFISEQALMGRFLRGLHYFGASAMVVLIGAHVARTYIMGAYKSPRELNWLSGALLLLLTMAL